MGRMLSTYTINVCHECAEHMAHGTGKVNLDWDAYPHAVLDTVGEPEFTGGRCWFCEAVTAVYEDATLMTWEVD